MKKRVKRSDEDFPFGTFLRECQECGNVQEGKDPKTYKNQEKEAWRDVKCKYCGSESLDYGSERTNFEEDED